MTSDIKINSLSAIDHILEFCPQRINKIFLSGKSERIQKLFEKAQKNNILVLENNEGDEKVSALIHPYIYKNFEETIRSQVFSFLIVLDHIQDPQNFGTICRTADFLGVELIVIPKDRSVDVSTGVYSASVGAVETVQISKVTNIGNTLERLKELGFWIVGSALNEKASDFSKMPTFEKVALVLGAEHEGLSSRVEKLCDWFVEIPKLGHVESLNVSVASGILMYEFSKRIRSGFATEEKK